MSMLARIQLGLDTVKFRVDQSLRVNQVRRRMSGIRKQIARVQEQIGSTVLNLYKNGKLTLPELEELCVTISSLEAQFNECEILIRNTRAESPAFSTLPSRDLGECPACHYATQIGALYCPNCGHGLGATAEPDPNDEKQESLEAGANVV